MCGVIRLIEDGVFWHGNKFWVA